MWSKLGMGAMGLAIIALGYPIIDGIIGLGYSDDLSLSFQSLTEILGEDNFLWIDYISIGLVQEAFLYLAKLPLFLLLFGISMIFFLIHFLVPENG